MRRPSTGVSTEDFNEGVTGGTGGETPVRLMNIYSSLKTQKNGHEEGGQRTENGVLRKLKHIFPNTYQRIKSICSPAKVGLVVIDLITSPVVSWRGWGTPPPPQHRGSAVILSMTSSEGQRGGRRAIIFILW